MVKSIYLQDGEEIFVDDEDYERVNQHTWWKINNKNSKFVCTQISKKRIGLNDFITGERSVQKKINQYFTRDNIATTNLTMYKKPNYNKSSRYKGVSKRANYWEVYISIFENGVTKRKYVGSFSNEDDAGKAYNEAVDRYHNGNAYKNVIGEDNREPKSEWEKVRVKRRKKKKNMNNYRGTKKIGNKFSAEGSFKGKNVYFGIFPSLPKAALAYNKCAIYLHGDDAILNEVPMTDELKEFIDNWEIPEKIKQLKE